MLGQLTRLPQQHVQVIDALAQTSRLLLRRRGAQCLAQFGDTQTQMQCILAV